MRLKSDDRAPLYMTITHGKEGKQGETREEEGGRDRKPHRKGDRQDQSTKSKELRLKEGKISKHPSQMNTFTDT